MKSIYFISFSLLLIGIYSFSSAKKQEVDSTQNNTVLIENDTMKINYGQHKELLDILALLPDDYGMQQFNWPQKERIAMVEFIKKENYWSDSIIRIEQITPQMIQLSKQNIQWTLAIYQFQENDYFLVTDENYEGKEDVQTFNYINEQFSPTKMVNYFEEYFDELHIIPEDFCMEILPDPSQRRHYDFTEKDLVKISLIDVKKDELSIAELNGNTIQLSVNREKRSFDADSTYWSNPTQK
jgi:hypothetical protein